MSTNIINDITFGHYILKKKVGRAIYFHVIPHTLKMRLPRRVNYE